MDKATAQAVAQILTSAGFTATCNKDYTSVEVSKVIATVTDVNQLVSIIAPGSGKVANGTRRRRRTKVEIASDKAAASMPAATEA